SGCRNGSIPPARWYSLQAGLTSRTASPTAGIARPRSTRRFAAQCPLIIEVRQEVWLCALALIAMSAPVVAQPSQGAQPEVIAAIQVQGNTLTPDDEVVSASG